MSSHQGGWYNCTKVYYPKLHKWGKQLNQFWLGNLSPFLGVRILPKYSCFKCRPSENDGNALACSAKIVFENLIALGRLLGYYFLSQLQDSFHGNSCHQCKMMRPRLIETEFIKSCRDRSCWDYDFLDCLAFHCNQIIRPKLHPSLNITHFFIWHFITLLYILGTNHKPRHYMLPFNPY